MHNVVTNPRIISGIISEISASGAMVLVSKHLDNKVAPQQGSIMIAWGRKFDDTVFELLGIDHFPECELKIECIVGGIRVSFQVACESITNIAMPTEILISDYRDAKRISLNGSIFPAEIKYPGGVLLGFAHDISRDHIAIVTESSCAGLGYDLSCEVLVRSLHGGTDIFFREMRLFNMIDQACGKKIIFSGVSGNWGDWNDCPVNRADRLVVKPVTIDFFGPSIDGRAIKGRVEVSNVSITGFSGKKIVEDYTKNLMKGIVLSSNDPKVKFYLTREENDTIGFVIHPDDQISWIKYVETLNYDKTINSLDPQDLSNLFSLSAYVKDLRRGVYGKQMWAHLDNPDDYQHTLFRRVALHKEGAGLTDHVSSVRFSDNVWMIQEVIATVGANKGDVFQITDILLSRIRDEARFGEFSARYALVQFSESLPSVGEFWNRKAKKPGATLLRILHLSKFIGHSDDNHKDLTFHRTNDIEAQHKMESAKLFDPLILEIFDYWSASTNNPILNQLLKKYGKGHRTTTWLIRINGVPSAIVYRVYTHYSVNSTGMLTGVYCHFSKNFDKNTIPQFLDSLKSQVEITRGSSDLVVIQSNQKISKNDLDKTRSANEFSCVVMDLKTHD